MNARMARSRASGLGKSPRRRQRRARMLNQIFDLVQPTGVVGQEVELDASGMGGNPGVDGGPAVDIEVVEYQMDDLAGGDSSVEEVEERDHLQVASALADLSDDLSGVHIEGGQQAASPMADILDRAPGQLARATQGRSGKQRWRAWMQVFSSKDQTGPSLGRFT